MAAKATADEKAAADRKESEARERRFTEQRDQIHAVLKQYGVPRDKWNDEDSEIPF